MRADRALPIELDQRSGWQGLVWADTRMRPNIPLPRKSPAEDPRESRSNASLGLQICLFYRVDRQPAGLNHLLAFSRADLTFPPRPGLFPEPCPPLFTSHSERLVDHTRICVFHLWPSVSSLPPGTVASFAIHSGPRPYMYANRRAIQPPRPRSRLRGDSGNHSAT